VSRRVAAAALGLAILAVAGCGGDGGPTTSTSATPGRPLLVGAVEDASKFGDGPAKTALARRAGLRALVLSAVWTPPLTRPVPTELNGLRGAVDAAVAAGIEPIVAVYSFGRSTPRTPATRRRFAAFAASIPRALPAVRTVSVGNEPNVGLFWRPQFGPDGADAAAGDYLALLAETYDALKEVSPSITVIGGSLAARGSDDPDGRRQTHSPTAFLADLGAAYRASGRARPVMDAFSIHPYPEASAIPPDFEHPRSTTISIGDYDKLVRLLGDAFDGTAQPGSSLPVVYGEYGIQTRIPRPKASAYTGAEQHSTHATDEATQARFHAEAIGLAACQPTVSTLLFFHVVDEPQLERLQTGVYYADGTPKSSRARVAAAARKAAAGQVTCRP
jgi:hypothetical protein